MRLPNRVESILLFFIFIGAVLRLWNIGFQNTNWDEEFTMSFCSPAVSAVQVFVNSMTIDFTPPFYYLAAHFSMILLGQNPVAIRIPSAICGILLIPIMFYVGKEFRDELFGLIAAGFTAIFYNAFFYSRYGRSYAMDLMFFSAAFYFFIRALHGDSRAKLWFAVFSVFSMWTHLYSAIPIGILTGYLILNSPIEIKQLWWLGVMVAGASPLLNYIGVIISQRCVDGPECQWTSTNAFGASLQEIAFLTPVDLFAYSAFVIVPIVVWQLWKNRNDTLMRIISIVTITTWASMFILYFKTPIILHYSIFLVPMLLLALILPFWEGIRNKTLNVWHGYSALVIFILEIVQIFALFTIQRGVL